MNQFGEKPKSDKDFAKEFFRYKTKSKEEAFSLMQELEEEEKPVLVSEANGKKRYRRRAWRTSCNFNNKIAFDIDSHDEKNLGMIVSFYEKLFGKFVTIRTVHGYHLISKNHYVDREKWNFDICRVLCPILRPEEFWEYTKQVIAFCDKRKEERDKLNLDRMELQKLTQDFEEKFKNSGLYCGVGNFEILFAVNVILRGFYSLRISKKSKNDKPEVIE